MIELGTSEQNSHKPGSPTKIYFSSESLSLMIRRDIKCAALEVALPSHHGVINQSIKLTQLWGTKYKHFIKQFYPIWGTNLQTPNHANFSSFQNTNL